MRLRPRSRGAARDHRAPTAQHVVFTSVDGTLLDAVTFDPGPGRSMIQRLHEHGVPVVPVTVMTLDEMEPIARELGMRHMMIIEAGGAIARWTHGGWEVEACGPPAETVLDVVREVEKRSGADLLVYSVMPPDEASRLSGRSGEMLSRSTNRRFSEPFVIENGVLTKVVDAAASLGFAVRRGRRFFHLCRKCDEGAAFLRVRSELGCDVAIAVGGAPVDAEFLGRAEIAIVVPGTDGVADQDLLHKVPGARIAPAPGPAGWAAAIATVLPMVALARHRARGA